jgi:hypothetical protein
MELVLVRYVSCAVRIVMHYAAILPLELGLWSLVTFAERVVLYRSSAI